MLNVRGGLSYFLALILLGAFVGLFASCTSQVSSEGEVKISSTDNSDPPTHPDPPSSGPTPSSPLVTPVSLVGTPLPEVDKTVSTTVADATRFLYTGDHPVQSGVVEGFIQDRRVALLRGKVLNKEDEPIAGVTVRILNVPGLGSTKTQEDGSFHLVVNGGSSLTLNYDKAGFLRVQRTVTPLWQSYTPVETVRLIPLDSQVTSISTSSPDMQVARASKVTDENGTRQATLLFPDGNSAVVKQSDGTTRSLSNLSVRATEYTVGLTGPSSMPGSLPASSGYTYAVEFSVDEASESGDTEIRFSKPIISYTENFLGFPVGSPVPAGFYDRGKGIWVPSDNGRIIKIHSINSGIADLDISGGGMAAGSSALAALGVTDAERRRLATLYSVGKTLWRVPIPHFTPWDFNWPYSAEAGSQPPNVSLKDGRPICEACEKKGSVIEAQNQILGETLPIRGTPFTLNYRSDRTRGQTHTVLIPLSGPSVPPILKRIELKVEVAGNVFERVFPSSANQTFEFHWDGKDVFGRVLEGAQELTATLSYVYDGVYRLPEETAKAFGAGLGGTLTGVHSRTESAIIQVSKMTIGTWDSRTLGLGAWTLNVHHAYDPVGKVLYLGDGGRVSSEALAPVINTIVGTGVGFSGDGGPALQAKLRDPSGLTVGPDGVLYISDTGNHRVRKVGLDGIIHTIAGTGVPGHSGDNGPGVSAQLNSPMGLSLASNGNLYIVDSGNRRVRRLDPQGIIRPVAGGGNNVNLFFSGDGGPALIADMFPTEVAAADDGSIYVVDNGNSRIRRITVDGIINTVAGNGGFRCFPNGDGGPATQAFMSSTRGIAFGKDGSFTFSEAGGARRVGADGVINLVTQSCFGGFAGDGGPASGARTAGTIGVAIAPDGTLYLSDVGNNRIRKIDPQGMITTYVGTGGLGFSGDGGPAPQSLLNRGQSLAVGPDSSLYIADIGNHRIRRVTIPLPGLSFTDIVMPSGDGETLYIFSPQGRHLRTLNAVTGAILLSFDYDAPGFLTAITDASGNITRIERDSQENPTAILSSYGQRTSLTVGNGGFLAKAIDPSGKVTQMTYGTNNLLSSLIDPNSGVHVYTYDALGRLIQDNDPSGGFSLLARIDDLTGFTVSFSTALGRVSQYLVAQLVTGGSRRENTEPTGAKTVAQIGLNGVSTVTQADGTVTTTVQGPDPRWGSQAPLTTSKTIRLPSGQTLILAQSQEVTLSDSTDPMSIITRTETHSVDGRQYKREYEASTRKLTSTTPMGRQQITKFDPQGRPIETHLGDLVPLFFNYDSQGRVSSIQMGTGSDTRTRSYQYDSKGNLSVAMDPLGRTTKYAYDANSRLTQLTFPGETQARFSYDGNGNILSVTPPGRGSYLFAHDPLNQPISSSAPGSDQPALISYNLDRQPTRVSRANGDRIDYSFDTMGRLSALSIARGTIRYDYDLPGRVSTLTGADGNTLSYSYDGFLLLSERWGGSVSGTVTRTYHGNFQLASERVNNESIVFFGYDADGLLTLAGPLSLTRSARTPFITTTSLNQISDSFLYNEFGEGMGYEAKSDGTQVFKEDYTRDVLGRISAKITTVLGSSSTFSYNYDSIGRLKEVKKDGLTISSYNYDSNGNRLSLVNSSGASNGTYDGRDRLLTYGGTSYTYNEAGDLTAKADGSGTTTYTYDALGNLLKVILPNLIQIDYLVDGRNRRIGKKSSSFLVQGFLYDDQLRLVAELNGLGGIVSRFVYATGRTAPDYLIKSGEIAYRIICDHLGSPRLVVNSTTGEIAQMLEYDEFGTVILDTNPGFQPFGFAGGLYDPSTRLTRFGARDYDASVGRWTTQDPLGFAGSGPNLYEYAHGDPINGVDRNGLEWESTPMMRMAVQEFTRGLVSDGRRFSLGGFWNNAFSTRSSPLGEAPYLLCAEQAIQLRTELEKKFKGKGWTFDFGMYFNFDLGPLGPSGHSFLIGYGPKGEILKIDSWAGTEGEVTPISALDAAVYQGTNARFEKWAASGTLWPIWMPKRWSK